MRGVFANRHRTADTPNLAAQGQSVSRKTVAEVPLAGLSLPIRKILVHLGEPLEPPPVSPARGPPTDWGELVQAEDDRAIFQGRTDELPAIDIHSL